MSLQDGTVMTTNNNMKDNSNDVSKCMKFYRSIYNPESVVSRRSVLATRVLKKEIM